MYSVRYAYLFWIPSFFGVAGLQRIYLGKIGSGIIYLLTGGLFGLGTLYDAFTLPEQVREANAQRRIAGAPRGFDEFLLGGQAPESEAVSIEHVILKTARKNDGWTTPSEIALEANIPAEEARHNLDDLAQKGFAEMRLRKRTGNMVYVFPEFLTDDSEQEFEDF